MGRASSYSWTQSKEMPPGLSQVGLRHTAAVPCALLPPPPCLAGSSPHTRDQAFERGSRVEGRECPGLRARFMGKGQQVSGLCQVNGDCSSAGQAKG